MHCYYSYIVAYDEFGNIASSIFENDNKSIMPAGGQVNHPEEYSTAALRCATEQGWNLKIREDVPFIEAINSTGGLTRWYLGSILDRCKFNETSILIPYFAYNDIFSTMNDIDLMNNKNSIKAFNSDIGLLHRIPFPFVEDQQSTFMLLKDFIEVKNPIVGEDVILCHNSDNCKVYRIFEKNEQDIYIKRIAMNGKLFGRKLKLPDIPVFKVPTHHQQNVIKINKMKKNRCKMEDAEWNSYSQMFPEIITDDNVIQSIKSKIQHSQHGSKNKPITGIEFCRMMDMIDKELKIQHRDILKSKKDIPYIDLWHKMLDLPFKNFHRDAINLWHVKWFNLDNWHPVFHMHIQLLNDITKDSPARCEKYVRFHIYC